MASEVFCPDCKVGTIKPLDRCTHCGLSYEALLDAEAFLSTPRPGVFDMRRQLGRAPTVQEYRDAGGFSATENRKETP